ncbi:MAG: hypothetical protein Q9201_005157 [Fulgogasparrea decipioides]
MESLAALGLASNILQFLDFSGKLISGTVEFYHAVDGATSSNRVLEHLSKDLDHLCTGLVPAVAYGSGLGETESEAPLLPLAQSCRTLGREFLAVLEDLKVKSHRKRFDSARQALRSAWKARDIQKFDNQLGSYRSQIAFHLLVLLVSGPSSFGIYAVNEAAELRKGIVDSIKQAFGQQGISEITDLTKGDKIQLPTNLSSQLSNMITASALLQKQFAIIDSLQFSRISEREDNIKRAHPTTFEWLFDTKSPIHDADKRPLILDWLKTGSGVFWVSGKAGSGKSTLMKFFYHNKKTITALQQWAGQRNLLVASYFFRNAGTAMQKNQQGLLQTLLYHIFRQSPALIATVCPSRWNQSPPFIDPWSPTEVLQAFEKLKEQPLDFVRFCFFIDGLDEFDGDHLDIIKTINTFASSAAIKVWVSSRPWTVFENAYGYNVGFRIRLQDLTRGDIIRFVEDRLAEGTHFLRLKATDTAYANLIREIVDRSDGVFLWVFLVVNSLRRGMTNLDTICELQKRLRKLPLEMEESFQHILDPTEEVYHQQAARLYLVRLVAVEPLTIADVLMFANSNHDFALDEYVTEIDLTSQLSLETTKTRILVRCQDLLEFDCDSRLQFLHRTVKDYLETKDMQNLLDKRAGQDFSPHHFICNSKLLQMRRTAHFSEVWDVFVEDFDHALKTFWPHAHIMELENRLDYRLLPMLDRAAWKLVQERRRRWPSYARTHHKGWLADTAAENGIKGFLPHSIGIGFQTLSDEGTTIALKAPLDVALQCMRSNYRLEIIQRLLDMGADPNETI